MALKKVTMGLKSQYSTDSRALMPRFARKPGMAMFSQPSLTRGGVSIPKMKSKLTPMSGRLPRVINAVSTKKVKMSKSGTSPY